MYAWSVPKCHFSQLMVRWLVLKRRPRSMCSEHVKWLLSTKNSYFMTSYKALLRANAIVPCGSLAQVLVKLCFTFDTESHRMWFDQPVGCRLSIFIQSIFPIAQFLQPILCEERRPVPAFSHSFNIWSRPSFRVDHLQMIVTSIFTLCWTKGTDPINSKVWLWI